MIFLFPNDYTLRIVKIGDEQVSDLFGWSIPQFIQIWQKIAKSLA